MGQNKNINRKELRLKRCKADLTVVGGGMAGVCCAITAARAGLKVVLIQDRPVVGGNASSEVRLWILGATSHMGNNNRWAREGGVIDEILVENMYRNPEGNPLIVDTVLLEKVVSEPNITLLLNTAVHDLTKSDADTIKTVRAFCPQNSTAYEVTSPLFCDASGDGIVGFLAGAAFRMGAEASSEFGEKFAPKKACSALLGSSMYFYSKDTGRPVKFVAPSYALKDIKQIPRWRDFNANDHGCRLWWIEWGGHLDLVHDAEAVKWELWKVVYGVWNHIKNSGLFPEAENLTLEWVGTIPGKRESRRFEGDYMLTQVDIVEQRKHPDAVSYGGWAIDLHPPDGVFSKAPSCTQWHSKGVYQIPYRCLYSRNISNLFLAGRLISVSHVAFGSTRVMATCAHNGQAVAMAAVLCLRYGLKPRDISAEPYIVELRQELLKSGQYIPGLAMRDSNDLVQKAILSASSELKLAELKPNGENLRLEDAWAMLLPVKSGAMPAMEVKLDVDAPTTLNVKLRISDRPDNYTPDKTIDSIELKLSAGKGQKILLPFNARIDEDLYAFVCFMANQKISVWLSDQRLTGVLSLTHKVHHEVAISARQEPPPGNGIPSFEFWIPQRRPNGKNFAMTIVPPIGGFDVENLKNGITRPARQPNAWVADFDDANPAVTITWPELQSIGRMELVFDNDYDHPMESVLRGHPETVMPFCVQQVDILNAGPAFNTNETGQHSRSINGRKEISALVGATATLAYAVSECSTMDKHNNGGKPEFSIVRDELVQLESDPTMRNGAVLAKLEENHQSKRTIRFDPPIITSKLIIRMAPPPAGHIPAALFALHCYTR